MARRRKNDDRWIWPMAQLVGVIMLACMILPGVRQTLISIGATVLVIVGFAFVGLLGYFAFRKSCVKSVPCQLHVEREVPTQHLGSRRWNNSNPIQPPSAAASTTADLIKQLHSMDWFQFEKLIGHVYRKRGYTVTRRGGAKPDGGIDLIVEKSGQRVAVQCKQWKTWNVGVKPVREFLGALTDAGLEKGIFITLRGYTGDARQLAAKHRIEIVDATGLTQMLESTDARFDPAVLELLHDTRKFCPKCERELVSRVAKKGRNIGNAFWGCSAYPHCNYTLPNAEVNLVSNLDAS